VTFLNHNVVGSGVYRATSARRQPLLQATSRSA
jgi:hypothetical protein